MANSSPTQRTLARLRADGWLAEVVERWIPGANVRKDLWGFVDVVAIKSGVTLGVQSTSGSNVAARVTKIADSPNLAAVRAAGWRLEVDGWRKNSAGRWVCRTVDVS